MTTSDRGIFGRCPRCGRHDFLNRHSCPPLWLVWEPGDGQTEGDAQRIYARSASLAAERFAARVDNYCDYDIAEGHCKPVLCVMAAGGGEVAQFEVAGAYERTYEAVPVKDGKGPRATTNRVSTKRKAGA
jgi:hypothetical protein